MESLVNKNKPGRGEAAVDLDGFNNQGNMTPFADGALERGDLFKCRYSDEGTEKGKTRT